MSSFSEIKKNEFKNLKDFNTAKNEISKINSEKLIQEALYLGKKRSYKKNTHRIIHLKDDLLLEEMRIKILKGYLDSVKDKTIKEIKSELNTKIDEYIKNIRILLIKSNSEVDEYKKRAEKMEKDYFNIKQINASLIQFNKNLIGDLKNYQSSLDSLQKSYELLVKQKELFELILKEYSGNSPDQILSELKLAKEGSILLLGKYNEIIRENSDMKNKIENMEKKYEEKMETFLKDFNDYKEDKINEEKENAFRIRFLENKLYNNEKYQKDNYNLHRILYYIYNLLFEEFSLNKDIKINEKLMNIKEKDFEPNVMYNEEIKNYIKLMVKSMHRESMDLIFREIIGYLNMIIRKYFPNKKNLRFKPVQILIEINNFLDKKIRKINDDKLLIEQYKNNFIKVQKENLKINRQLSKEKDTLSNDSYQVNTDNPISFEKNSMNNFRQSFNKMNNLKKKISLTNQNMYNTPYTNKINTININNSNNISLYRIRKNKLKNINNKSEDNKLIKKKNIFEARKAIKTLSLLSNNSENDNINNNLIKLNEKTRNKSGSIFKAKTMQKNIYNDKIIKENGNDKEIKKFQDYNFLIEETNRLILYQPRLNSYNERKNVNVNPLDNMKKDDLEENEKKYDNIFKIRNTKINEYYQNINNKLEKKIDRQLNNLIKNFKK